MKLIYQHICWARFAAFSANISAVYFGRGEREKLIIAKIQYENWAKEKAIDAITKHKWIVAPTHTDKFSHTHGANSWSIKYHLSFNSMSGMPFVVGDSRTAVLIEVFWTSGGSRDKKEPESRNLHVFFRSHWIAWRMSARQCQYFWKLRFSLKSSFSSQWWPRWWWWWRRTWWQLWNTEFRNIRLPNRTAFNR